jgi:alpha-amylase
MGGAKMADETAAKHVPGSFWTGFCGAAGVFCIGEVYGSDIGYAPNCSAGRQPDIHRFASQFQSQKWMDSVLGYPLYYGIVNGFGTPSGNMSSFVDIAGQVLSGFPVRYLTACAL